MTDEHKSINLSENSRWVSFEISGVDFECEIFETFDVLGDIDVRHRFDEHLCSACSNAFTIPAEHVGAISEAKCPRCNAEADKIRFSQNFLDDVCSHLRERFGVKRCSRSEASDFYCKIVELATEFKKKLG